MPNRRFLSGRRHQPVHERRTQVLATTWHDGSSKFRSIDTNGAVLPGSSGFDPLPQISNVSRVSETILFLKMPKRQNTIERSNGNRGAQRPADQHRLNGNSTYHWNYFSHSDSQQRKWNYAFFDDHVAFLSEAETCAQGSNVFNTGLYPKALWTLTPNE